MKGRKPKPTSRQISEGDPRDRGMGKLKAKLEAEPKAARGLPECPRHLKGRARAAWNFWADELEAMSLDNRPDAMMLQGACVNYARAVSADLILDRDGLIVEESTVDKHGNKIILKIRYHPAVSVSNAAWRQVRAFCSEFGLSPVSRTRLAVERQESTDDLASLLSQPRERKPTTGLVQ
jgi:P27 family predicted phage terminase small subunit